MAFKSSYFFKTVAVLLGSVLCFLVFLEILPKRIFSESKTLTQNVAIDSLLLETLAADSLAVAEHDTLVSRKITFEPLDGIEFPAESFEQYKGFQYLIPFFEKLYQLEVEHQGDIRIAYFGDSMTDGDMIVQDFRAAFQSQFGGNGVGFVSITSESAASRSSVTHKHSTNWKTQSYLTVKKPLKPFGVNGHVFFANDTLSNPWVSYKAGMGKHTALLYQPTLFYGHSSNEEGEVNYIIGKDTLVKALKPKSALNFLNLSELPVKSLKAIFTKADSIPIYGFNFDDGKGVHIDNFSNRGNSGLPISTFNPAVMQEFQKKFDYDLIVLHYGTNVLNYGSLNYNWYEKSMAKVVNHLKTCFPGVTVLVVSSADKATKYDLEMKTDSAVVPLTQAQKRYALVSKSGYFNLFEAMGGEGSMAKWVDEEIPAMANKDYTHFNYKGSQKVAGLLYDQLMQGYTLYKSLRKQKPKLTAKPSSDSVSLKPTAINEP